MSPLLLLGTEPISVVRMDLKPPLGNEARAMFLDEAKKFEKSIEEVIDFDPGYKLEEDECFEIKNFELPSDLLTACRQPLTADRLKPSDIPDLPIRSIVGYDFSNGKKRIFFQNFSKGRVVSPGQKFALWEAADHATFREITKPVIMLQEKVAMVWDDTTLRFKSFALAHRIFDLTSYFTEATDEQIDGFASNSKMTCADKAMLVKNCSSWHRKKIALIMRGKRLDAQTFQSLQGAASKVGYTLPSSDGKIQIPTDKRELRSLLQFLDEDLFLGSISEERFISSGKRLAPINGG